MSVLNLDGRREREFVAFSFLFIAGGLLGGALIALPAKLLPFFLGGCVCVGIAVYAIGKPIALIHFVVLTSATAGLFRSFESLDVGSTGLSVSGLRWVFVGAIACFILGFNFRKLQTLGFYGYFLAFTGWAILRALLEFEGGLGIKDLLFYSLPPILGIYTHFTLATDTRVAIGRIEQFILYSVFIPIVLYAVFLPLGLVHLTPNGPEGLLEPRPLALYLLIVVALGLAKWRYAKTKATSLRGALVFGVALGTILFTLSRVASMTALLLLPSYRLNPRKPWRMLPVFVLVPVLTTLALFMIPSYRDRMFHRPDTEISGMWRNLNSAGRFDYMWPATFQHALESPMIGWGPGSARVLVTNLSFRRKSDHEQYHPHNEYLQVFHDLGAIGLALLLLAWFSLLGQHWRRWRTAHALGDHVSAQWNMAVTLVTAMVMLSSVTDNTLHYTFVVAPLFIMSAVGLRVDVKPSRVPLGRFVARDGSQEQRPSP